MSWIGTPARFVPKKEQRIIPVVALRAGAKNPFENLEAIDRTYVEAINWSVTCGKHLVLRNLDGSLRRVLLGIEKSVWQKEQVTFATSGLAKSLPAKDADATEVAYRFEPVPPDIDIEAASLGWLLGAYRIRATDDEDETAALVAPENINAGRIEAMVSGIWLARNLINAPSNQLGTAELEAAARELAGWHDAEVSSVVGEDLLKENWPMIHAVGRASVNAPRIVDLRWGDEKNPRLALVGKGIIFDSGGLDIKPPSSMLLMKKDMGGAATALALAHMVMARSLPVSLRVLLPIAENAVAGNAFRPSDVLTSRSGRTIEIGDTDAEGRLVLADALSEASLETPDLLFDFATLTGSATAALGPEISAMFTDNDKLAAELETAGMLMRDPVWRLPMWQSYGRSLKTPFADISSTGRSRLGGAITAALFLRRFVANPENWVHFDIHAWTPSRGADQPGGGECQVARAVFSMLEQRYAGS